MRVLAGGVPWSGRESHLPYMRVLAGSASVKWAEKITYPTWKYLQEVYPEVAEKITYSMWKYAALKWAENITFPTYVSILAGGVPCMKWAETITYLYYSWVLAGGGPWNKQRILPILLEWNTCRRWALMWAEKIIFRVLAGGGPDVSEEYHLPCLRVLAKGVLRSEQRILPSLL